MATIQATERLTPERTDMVLIRLGRAVARLHAQALAPGGLRPRHGIALHELREKGPMSQQALGDALQVDPSNLVVLLNDLEGAGLATRRRDPADRRRHIVEISGLGCARLDEAEAALDAVYAGLMTPLGPDDRQLLQRLLAQVAVPWLSGCREDDLLNDG